MPKLIQPLDTGDPLGPLPQEFAAIMRPELPSLVMEIGVEVTRAYPEYARLLSGPNGQAIRVGVEQSLSAFVDLVAEPTSSTSLRDDMCRRFGRFEAYEGLAVLTIRPTTSSRRSCGRRSAGCSTTRCPPAWPSARP